MHKRKKMSPCKKWRNPSIVCSLFCVVNISFLVLIMYYSYINLRESWVKGTWNFSTLFLQLFMSLQLF